MRKVTTKRVARNVLISMVLIIFLGIIGYTVYGKYELNHKSYKVLSAKTFYFTSDLLKEDGSPVYHIANWNNQTSELSFYLFNTQDSNRFSTAEIDYKIYLNNDSQPVKSGNLEPAIDINHGIKRKITLQPQIKNQVNSSLGGQLSPTKYVVRAETVGQYETSLSATFYLYQEGPTNPYYWHIIDQKGSPTARLILGSHMANFTPIIQWDAGKVMIDRTHPSFFEKPLDNVSSVKLDTPGLTCLEGITVDFFKVIESDQYSKEDGAIQVIMEE